VVAGYFSPPDESVAKQMAQTTGGRVLRARLRCAVVAARPASSDVATKEFSGIGQIMSARCWAVPQGPRDADTDNIVA